MGAELTLSAPFPPEGRPLPPSLPDQIAAADHPTGPDAPAPILTTPEAVDELTYAKPRIARVTFTGIPSGTGLSKDTVILLTAGLQGL